MANRAVVDVWRVALDAAGNWPPPTPSETRRAERFVTEDLRRRHLRSHAALRAILGTYTEAPPDFVLGEHGKPYLPAVPDLWFNLSHSHETALIAVSRDAEVGVDVERLRALPDCMAIAERFFPPAEAATLAEVPLSDREAEFYRRWTRIEAVLKGRGIGLYGAGSQVDGWSVQCVDAGPEYVAAVAAYCCDLTVKTRNFAA